MDDLISRKAAIDGMNEYLNQPTHRGNRRWTKGCEAVALDLLSTIKEIPPVPAVPLDKLCEWLARNAFAFECEDCEEYCRALLDCEKEVGSDPEYWKNKLTKWMEEQDAQEKT